MPGYKGHLTAGVITFTIAYCVIKQWMQPSPLRAIEWLLCTLAGSLFPDIDVKSKGQKFSYVFLLATFLFLFAQGKYELLGMLSILAVIPMIVRHRGLFHRVWFIALCAAGLIVAGSCTTTIACTVLCVDALFFMLGALSHLWLDMGVRRMFKVR